MPPHFFDDTFGAKFEKGLLLVSLLLVAFLPFPQMGGPTHLRERPRQVSPHSPNVRSIMLLKSIVRTRRSQCNDSSAPTRVSQPHGNVTLRQPVVKRGKLSSNDFPKSGFLDMSEELVEGTSLRQGLEEECKRILGSDVGTLNALHLVHNYPYSKKPFINLLRPAVPRFFFPTLHRRRRRVRMPHASSTISIRHGDTIMGRVVAPAQLLQMNRAAS